LKKLILISLRADRQWEEVVGQSEVEEITVGLIFCSVWSLEFLYVGQKKFDDGRGFKYKKWIRKSVLEGDMMPEEEVLTHFADVKP